MQFTYYKSILLDLSSVMAEDDRQGRDIWFGTLFQFYIFGLHLWGLMEMISFTKYWCLTGDHTFSPVGSREELIERLADEAKLYNPV